MGKIAFVFPGQGAQYTGMGKDIYDNNVYAREIFDLVDLERPNTSNQCFFADEEELKKTINTQPCIFTVELALANALIHNDIKPDMVAGFSLGEITALTFANVLSIKDGIKFICKRGEYMQLDAEAKRTSMVAVLKLDNSVVENLASNFTSVFPVNYNCPGQLVVAGEEEELDSFSEIVTQNGGKAVKLAVGGGFHSPFMENASNKIKQELTSYTFNKSNFTVYSNLTAKPYGDNVSDLISEQVKSPVYWQRIVEDMIENGVDTFIEVGPGKVLSGFIKKISKDVKIYNVSDSVTLAEVVSILKEEI